MPIYEYRCEKGHVFEVSRSMSDDPVTACEECGAVVERVFHPVAVHYKGSGFYTTDYAKKADGSGPSGSDKSSDDSSASSSESKDSGSKSGSDGSKSDSSSKKSDSSASSGSSSSD